jgi:hypothetical protein
MKAAVAPFSFRLPARVRISRELAAAVLASTAVGACVTSPTAAKALVVGAAAVVAVLVGHWNRGALVGLLVLGVLNGLPILNTTPSAEPGANTLDDMFVLALFVALVWFNLAGVAHGGLAGVRRRVNIWAALFIGCCLVAILRAALFTGVPPVTAALFGRDFLYFAVLFPLMLGALRERRQIAGLLITLGIGALVFAVGLILISAFNKPVPALIHVSKTLDFEGFTRVYAPMADLLTAFLIMTVSFAVAAKASRRARMLAGVAAAVAASALALEFTRALYVSVFVAAVLTWLLWSFRENHAGQRIRMAGVLAGCAVIGLFAMTSVVEPQVSKDSAIGAVVERAASGIESHDDPADSVTYRVDLAKTSLTVLGSNLPVGLGFLDPDYRFVSDLPRGSIRNSDIGVFNVLMTMGLIGVLLLYGLLATVLKRLLTWREEGSGSLDWMRIGCSAWLISTLISSITLVTLFSVPGLMVTAIMLTLGLSSTGIVR